MASQSEPITTTDVVNYTGELFYIGAKYGKSPLLSMAGLTDGYRVVTGNQFAMANAITGNAPAQNAVSEDASIAAVTRTSYAASQGTNYPEIHNLQYVISYAAEALNGMVSGVANVRDTQAVVASMPTQRLAHMKQLAVDLEFSAMRGTGQAWTNAGTTGATGGLVTAVEAGSETAASGATLSTDLIDTEVARMAAAGAEFSNMVIAAGAYQLQRLGQLYSFAPQDRTVGGVNLRQVLLPIMGTCGVVYDPVLADDDLVFVDMDHFKPCFGIVPGKPPIFTETLAKVSGGTPEMLYCIFGIDYNSIVFHGMVSGLATS